MKNFFLYLSTMVVSLLLFTSCQDIDELTNHLPMQVNTTTDLTITKNQVDIRPDCYMACNRYIIISENADLSTPLYDGLFCMTTRIKNLKSGATYYYQEYYRDENGYTVMGTVEQFVSE